MVALANPEPEPNRRAAVGPRRDAPGQNTRLDPAGAPDWLDPLMGNLAAGAGDFGDRARVDEAAGSASAVLIALSGTRREDASVLLTHRNPRMRSHPGQIAFPGGRVDAEDVNAVDTALREAWEETGLDRLAVTPLAQLTALSISRSARPIHPVLAHWHRPVEVGAASPAETDHVFLASLAGLAAPQNRATVRWRDRTGPAFRASGYLIWGFTASVLDQLLTLGGWAREWDRGRVEPLEDLLAASRNDEPPR